MKKLVLIEICFGQVRTNYDNNMRDYEKKQVLVELEILKKKLE